MPGIKITVEKVTKEFRRGSSPLQQADLVLPEGDFLSVLGSSGSGKTTLLRILSGLEPPTTGEVLFAGSPSSNDLRKEGKISFVFQEANLLPWRSALENVLLPLELLGKSEKEGIKKAKEKLALVGLEKAFSLFHNELSGGMKMRVSLARALITEPQLLLLDEPFAALDETTRWDLDEELRRIWEQQKMTIVFVTHSMTEAVFLSERVLFLSSKTNKLEHETLIRFNSERRNSIRTHQDFTSMVEKLYQTFHRLGASVI